MIVAVAEHVRMGESGAALIWMDGRGAARVWSSGVQSGPRVLRDSSIMNPPVEISDINTNSFGMSNES